ncbi:hypothetical protein Cgig2_019218 [Carnegiea gigantea]|uniref:Uncharacterized protein n=1 Tax=Carnegiea gigantea TaxID=171969 RepID=A0A9Q1GJC4_9CARY|nr:hypothetical protein Cgig2_019218 [Carnegiea gigantea]
MDGPGATVHRCTVVIGVPPMAFPHSLDRKTMSEYVTHHFAWDRRGIAFPPSPLPKDFQTLCPGFELAMAEQAAEYYELSELPQLIFYAMLLSEVERLGVLQGQDDLGENSGAGQQEESSDTRVFIFPGQAVGNIGRASGIRISPVSMAFPLIYNTREMADNVRESFIWRWRSASRLPRPFPEDLHFLFPCFSLSKAEGAAADFKLPDIVQATFYVMLLNEAVEMGVVHDFTAESMKSSFIGLRWLTFGVWIDCVHYALRGVQLH